MDSAMIRIENLRKTFNEEEVLKGITCEFTRGETHAVIGNNGSGKSVFFKCICGFIEPTKGHIIVDGKEVGKDIDFPESIGVIIERPGFLPTLSGFKNLQLLAKIRKTITDEQVRETIQKVGLDPSSKKAVSKYSMGMKQRLGIAQAIMENPEILILDEPFNGLDKEGVKEIRGLLMRLKHEGKTIFLTSHNSEDIKHLADQVWEMDAGQLVRIE
ncbi:MAG: ATP-binding cassette domain-containing protein [Ruminococcus sp.]|nr:ATP-binding cassette domain-containing protein [Ruminococcus sp.]